jgi:hypothetical protein
MTNAEYMIKQGEVYRQQLEFEVINRLMSAQNEKKITFDEYKDYMKALQTGDIEKIDYILNNFKDNMPKV